MKTIANPLHNLMLVVLLSVASIDSEKVWADDQPIEHIVNIESFTFSPAILEVKLGDKVVWVNKDIVPHTATGVDKQWDTGKLEFDEQGKLVVTETVLGQYFCLYHPAMEGRIVLKSD